jgi:hypothetical protein
VRCGAKATSRPLEGAAARALAFARCSWALVATARPDAAAREASGLESLRSALPRLLYSREACAPRATRTLLRAMYACAPARRRTTKAGHPCRKNLCGCAPARLSTAATSPPARSLERPPSCPKPPRPLHPPHGPRPRSPQLRDPSRFSPSPAAPAQPSLTPLVLAHLRMTATMGSNWSAEALERSSAMMSRSWSCGDRGGKEAW